MKKNLFKISLFISLVLILVSPIVASAQPRYNPQTGLQEQSLAEFNAQNNINQGICQLGNNPKFQKLLSYVSCIIIRSVIPLIFALALAMFVWGVVQYVINSDEEAKKAKGKQFMLWGIIALTVMISVWGLVAILGNTFGINTGFIPQVRVAP